MCGKTSALCLLRGRLFSVRGEAMALHLCLSTFCGGEELEQEVKSEKDETLTVASFYNP